MSPSGRLVNSGEAPGVVGLLKKGMGSVRPALDLESGDGARWSFPRRNPLRQNGSASYLLGRKSLEREGGVGLTALRIAVVVVLLITGTLLFAWYDATEENPGSTRSNPAPTGLTIHILRVNWTVTGCQVPNVTTAGGSIGGAGNFNESVHLVNKNASTGCEISSVEISPASFQAQPGSVPFDLPANGSAAFTVSIRAPAFASPTVLSVDLRSGA